MIVLLAVYLYKFHLRPKVNKLVSVFKKPRLAMVLQPVESKASIV